MKAKRSKTSHRTYRWLIGRAKSSRRWVVVSILAGYCGGLLMIAQAYFLSGLIHRAFIGRQPLQSLWPSLTMLAVAILLRAAALWCREMSGFMTGAAVRRNVRQALMVHLFGLGPAHRSSRKSGELAAAAIEQIEALHDFFAFYLPQLALAAAVPLTIALVVLPISWAAGGLLLITAPCIPLFMALIGMGAESISQRHFQSLARLSSHFLDTLQGLATLKVFDRSRSHAAVIERRSEDYRKRTMGVLRIAFLSSAVLEFFSMVSIALVAVYLGLSYLGYIDFGAYGRPLTLAEGLFVLVLAPEFYLPLRELGTHYHARAKALAAADQILQILGENPKTDVAPGKSRQPPRQMRIKCQQLHLSYDGGRRPALRGVSLDIEPSEHIAVVGASGCGKTTLLNLLMGFLKPDAGIISVDGISIAEFDTESWLGRISWLGPDPYLFHGSIRENICLGRPEATENEVRRAAAAAHVLAFTEKLPAGLDTRIGERSFGLSRGQAQRVALARAVLKDSPLLLLDEPTAGLDSRSEKLVLDALDRFNRDRTVVMVTHRLTRIEKADRIYVIDEGRIAEQGSYRDLVAAGGLLSRLIQSASVEME